MAKGIITISLDIDIIEKLEKIKGKSSMINAYLKNYFNDLEKSKEDKKNV